MKMAKLTLEKLALALYQQGVLSIGRARRLAGVKRWHFEQLLADRHIPRHYTETDLQDDLGYARREGPRGRLEGRGD
jgi:predicted HTH domain antitoxin